MTFFGLGQKKDSSKVGFAGKHPQGLSPQNSQGSKAMPAEKTKRVTSSSSIETMPFHGSNYPPPAKIPGDAAFINPMGDVNQPAAVYQQHLARQWQHKAAERAEMRQSAANEEYAMVAPQTSQPKSMSGGEQWPIMPLQFQIEHFDIQSTRYYTMFPHLGIGEVFFTGVIEVYTAASKQYLKENKKTIKQLRAEDWQEIGNRTANFVNKAVAISFNQLVRLDYKWSKFQNKGHYILTYPVRPEDIIPWCEAHKLPYLNEVGRADWAEHKAKLERGEPSDG